MVVPASQLRKEKTYKNELKAQHVGLRLPQSQLTVLGVGADKILMRMVANADDIFLVDVERPLEFAGGRGETVEDKVLADTVDPLAARGYTARYEVAPGPFA